MINIEKLTDSGFRALLPASSSASPVESFSLAGFQTRIGTTPENPSDPPYIQMQFAPLDPGLHLAERRGKFSSAERDNILCLLASPDARFGSLQINAAVQVYTCALGTGQQITYRPAPDRSLWIRPLTGKLALNGSAISEGEVARVSDESEIRLAGLGNSDCEFVLLVLS
jgi:redox-sensitive bicupin YhaK (pirin superfamily)